MARSTAAQSPAAFSTFGDLLQYLRRRQRLTQIDLAIAVGYSPAQISRLEQNLRLPNPSSVLAQFVPALGLEEAPEMAARLLELAQAARGQRDADTQPPDQEIPGDQHVSANASIQSSAMPSDADVLITKLYRPRPRVDRVARSRLWMRLDAALSVPLTLVSAPAGFGKTTLLADWLGHIGLEAGGPRLDSAPLASRSQPVVPRAAWLSLDDGDNDPNTFLRYLITATQALAPALGGAAMALLRSSQPPAPEALLRMLLNDLAVLPGESLLVLDDFHLIATPAIHHALAFLAEHVPPQLHLIVSSRADPPLPLARLRARGQLVEIRAADLRFTAEEAATFLTASMGLALSAADIATLEARAEGWIAGLQLAALAMPDRSNAAGFLSAFTGSNRFVGEYLVGEVFARQPAHLQAFLLQTSILDRMCGALCDAVVLGTRDWRLEASEDREIPSPQSPAPSLSSYSQLLLEQLEQSNLFTIALDDQQRWFRYHHLFGEALRERLLNGATAAAISGLHRRASTWYEEQGLVVEAIHHALAPQDWERAATLIEAHGLPLILGGQVHTALGWLKMLPDAFVQQRPHACLMFAIGLIFINQASAAEAWLHNAERALSPDAPDELARLVRGMVAVVQGGILYFTGDLAHANSLMQQALALLPEAASNTPVGIMSAIGRTVAAVSTATSYQLTGDVSAASEERVVEAIMPGRLIDNITATLHGYTSLAHLQMLQGRLRAAAATYAEIERLASSEDALYEFVGSPSYYIGKGDLLRERNDLEAAEGALVRCMSLVQGGLAVHADVIVQGYMTLARVQQSRGDPQAARATLAECIRLARERGFFALLIEQVVAVQARFQLLLGDLATAIRWADASGLDSAGDLDFPREPAHLTLARVRIAQGRAGAVLELLERMLADAEGKARMHSAIEILAVQALAYAALSERPRALSALAQALALAEPEGYVRIFVDEGLPMATLLRDIAANGGAPDYAARLLAAFDS